jgi:uncharacterized protein YoxC
MRELHQDRDGFVAAIVLAVVVLVVVVLLLMLYQDVQKLMDDLSRLFHPLGAVMNVSSNVSWRF